MTSTAVRLARAAVVVVLALLLPTGLAAPAWAAGTGGIDLSPYPAIVDGRQITAFHTDVPSRGSVSVRYSLHNVTKQPRTVRVYAASATRNGGSFSVGTAGSSPYLTFPTRTVTLAGGETQLGTFTVHGPVHGTTYGALVVEVTTGSITQRAATLVYLKKGRTVPVPLLLTLLAVLALALAGGAVSVVARRRAAAPASYSRRPALPTSSP
jgi:hypothetical protein